MYSDQPRGSSKKKSNFFSIFNDGTSIHGGKEEHPFFKWAII